MIIKSRAQWSAP